MRDLLRVDVADGRRAVIQHSTRADGDLSPATVMTADLERRRAHLAPGSWHALRQVHGNGVVDVVERTPADPRPEGDALVTDRSHHVLVVHTGDCVPIGLVDHGGAVAVAHAGWKGLEAGVVDSAVTALRQRVGAGATGDVVAAVGPHIRVDRYEFGDDDLARLVERFGDTVAGSSGAGRPALDLTAATSIALAECGVEIVAASSDCTAAEHADYWSHRARGEAGRIGLVAWLGPA